jgi:hypothetical protein
MATRNLARTVVEGGRARYSKDERRGRNRRRRRLRFDEEGNVIAGKEKRDLSPPGFADRLNPLERWLGHHVGLGWSNVYREFCERFDRRTTKGRHLDEHLLGSVGLGRCQSGRYFVDARGILRREYQDPGWARRSSQPTPRAIAAARRWAKGRQVIVRGATLFWTAGRVHLQIPASAQGQRLSTGDVTFWSALPVAVRESIIYDAEANRRRRALAAGGCTVSH